MHIEPEGAAEAGMDDAEVVGPEAAHPLNLQLHGAAAPQPLALARSHRLAGAIAVVNMQEDVDTLRRTDRQDEKAHEQGRPGGSKANGKAPPPTQLDDLPRATTTPVDAVSLKRDCEPVPVCWLV